MVWTRARKHIHTHIYIDNALERDTTVSDKNRNEALLPHVQGGAITQEHPSSRYGHPCCENKAGEVSVTLAFLGATSNLIEHQYYCRWVARDVDYSTEPSAKSTR